MAYIMLRVDFSTDDECHFCDNRLRSGKVRILVDDEGREVQAGPVCAKKFDQSEGEDSRYYGCRF